MEPTPNKSRRQLFISETWLVVLAMLAITMVVYGDVLLKSPDTLLSSKSGDTFRYHYFFRAFGFGEMAQGNMPLWNPFLFSGNPMLASIQAGLMYPLNITYLFFPIGLAINFDFCLHVFLMGLFTYAWIRNRNLPPLAAFFASSILMFGSATALRVLAGQVNVVAVLAWIPFLFLCVDRIIDRGSVKWCCIGIAATAMQIFAGYPPAVYMTALALGGYIAVRFVDSPYKIRALGLFAALAIYPVLLSAMQLWIAADTGFESIRSGGISYKWVTTFSLPPENLLTVLTPVWFGDHLHLRYWGRSYFWDASVFLGITGFSLALFGAFCGARTARRERIMAFVFVIFYLSVALGEHSPVYYVLYKIVPGFNLFRAPGRFTFLALLFMALLAAHGVSRLIDASAELDAKRLSRVLWIAGGTTSSVMLALFLAASTPDSVLSRIFLDFVESGTASLFRLESGSYIGTGARALVVKGLSIAGLTAIVLGCLVHLRRKHTWATYCVVLLGVAELLIFARVYRGTFQVEELGRPDLEALYAENPGDYRVFDRGGNNGSGRNYAMKNGNQVIWGYDPMMLWRYAEFFRLTHNFQLKTIAMSILPPQKYTPIYGMLRCRFMVQPTAGSQIMTFRGSRLGMGPAPKVPEDERILEVDKNPAPRFFFVQDYKLVTDAEEIVAQLMDEDFDYRKTVILESEPKPSPERAGVEASVTVVDESTDHVTLDIALSSASILVNTDAFSNGWHITALSNEVDQEYAIMPANLAIRAVPLAAGRHRIRLEYAPRSYAVGLWVSAISTLVFLLFCGGLAIQSWRARRRANSQS